MLGIVMAGGKSSRFGKEKLIQYLGEKRIIDISIENISRSKVDEYYVAVSKNAPITMEYCKKFNTIVTPGAGYPEDVAYLLRLFERPILLLNGDSVFIGPEIINDFLSKFRGKSMAAVIFDHGYKFIGLNIAVPNDERDVIIEYNDINLGLNINTAEDLKEATNIVTRQ
ncbi:MAG: NTP transferase domain-containing protein [Thermoplasmatales archaeon]